MIEPRALTTARAYHRAWSTKRLADLEQLVGDDLRVEVPLNAYAGKAEFLEAVRRTASVTSNVRMLGALGNEDEAVLLYDMTLPIGVLRVAEHFSVSRDQIRVIRQIHDTAALRAAGFERSAP